MPPPVSSKKSHFAPRAQNVKCKKMNKVYFKTIITILNQCHPHSLAKCLSVLLCVSKSIINLIDSLNWSSLLKDRWQDRAALEPISTKDCRYFRALNLAQTLNLCDSCGFAHHCNLHHCRYNVALNVVECYDNMFSSSLTKNRALCKVLFWRRYGAPDVFLFFYYV